MTPDQRFDDACDEYEQAEASGDPQAIAEAGRKRVAARKTAVWSRFKDAKTALEADAAAMDIIHSQVE